MAEVTRPDGLELDEDLPFQKRQWRASRMLWLVLVALMAATALGVFGNGPLSRAEAGDPDGPLHVEYERVARFGASVRLVVRTRPQADGTVQFRIDRSLLDAFRVQDVTPPPSAAALADDGVESRFQAHTPRTLAIVFEMQPAARWSVQGRIQSPDGAVRLRQFILP
jgi:hypothetical protein